MKGFYQKKCYKLLRFFNWSFHRCHKKKILGAHFFQSKVKNFNFFTHCTNNITSHFIPKISYILTHLYNSQARGNIFVTLTSIQFIGRRCISISSSFLTHIIVIVSSLFWTVFFKMSILLEFRFCFVILKSVSHNFDIIFLVL